MYIDDSFDVFFEKVSFKFNDISLSDETKELKDFGLIEDSSISIYNCQYFKRLVNFNVLFEEKTKSMTISSHANISGLKLETEKEFNVCFEEVKFKFGKILLTEGKSKQLKDFNLTEGSIIFLVDCKHYTRNINLNVVFEQDQKTVLVSSNDRIVYLKETIESEFNVYFKRVSFKFGNILLDSRSKKLREYGLVEGSTISLHDCDYYPSKINVNVLFEESLNINVKSDIYKLKSKIENEFYVHFDKVSFKFGETLLRNESKSLTDYGLI